MSKSSLQTIIDAYSKSSHSHTLLSVFMMEFLDDSHKIPLHQHAQHSKWTHSVELQEAQNGIFPWRHADTKYRHEPTFQTFDREKTS